MCVWHVYGVCVCGVCVVSVCGVCGVCVWFLCVCVVCGVWRVCAVRVWYVHVVCICAVCAPPTLITTELCVTPCPHSPPHHVGPYEDKVTFNLKKIFYRRNHQVQESEENALPSPVCPLPTVYQLLSNPASSPPPPSPRPQALGYSEAHPIGTYLTQYL